jgi:hypothetical protein
VSESKSRLRVLELEPGIELFVVNHRLERIEKAVSPGPGGALEYELEPGIYKLRFRAGYSMEDHLVALEAGQTLEFRAPRLAFKSAAPLQGTADFAQPQRKSAHRISQQTQRELGQGGGFFLYISDPDRRGRRPLAQGVGPHDLQGQAILDVQKAGRSSPRSAPEPWFALSASLEPGSYRLRVDTAQGKLEHSVIVCPGWQTQIFLRRTPFWHHQRSRRAPNLFEASVLMLPLGEGFRPDRPDLRWTELARQGLSSGRAVLEPGLVDQLLDQKLENPMLSLLGGHLLLLGNPEQGRLERIVRRLREILNHPHPDVEALALRAGLEVEPLSAPPLLRSSWALWLQGSLKRPELIPLGSFPERISTAIAGGGAWLVWQYRPQLDRPASSPAQDPVYRQMKAQVSGYLHRLQQYTQLTQPEPSPPPQSLSQLAQQLPPDPAQPEMSPAQQLAQATGLPLQSVKRILEEE